MTERDPNTEAAFQRCVELLRESNESAPTPAPAVAWHEHGAFDEIEKAQSQISRARDALAGIAALMQPDSKAADEQLDMAHRSDAVAIFDFFAEAMSEPLDVLNQAVFRLQQDLRAGQP